LDVLRKESDGLGDGCILQILQQQRA
jgi:hypothetical protein